MHHPYVAPEFEITAFNCPFCHAYSNQQWHEALISNHYPIPNTYACHCKHCSKWSIWFDGKMIYPTNSTAPYPNDDIPEDIKLDYYEAREIVNFSPRGAAALLRLCIQKLCKVLGESGENINVDIGALVKKGLSPRIQKV